MPRPLPSHTRRLSALVNQPGGLTADEAVKAAEACLDGIREASLAEIASLVDKIVALGDAFLRAPSQTACESLYTTSNVVVGAAGVFKMPELGEVAFSLCKLLDCQRGAGLWNLPAVRLHLDSLKLMCGKEEQASKRTVIDALHQVVERVCHRSG